MAKILSASEYQVEGTDFPPPAPVLTSTGRGWAGIEIVRYDGYVGELELPPSPYHVVGVYLGRTPNDIIQRLDGRVYKGRFHKGEIGIVPAGTAYEGSWERPAGDGLELRLSDAHLRGVAESVDVDPDGLEIVHRLCVPDPRIERIGLSLKAEVEAGDAVGGKLYAESLANALAISLIRDHSSVGREAAGELTGGLSKRALEAAIDYVGDNLQQDLTLADIAGAVHMSPYHFSRLFKKSTGLAPHQYVVERRVQRARELLVGTALPIAEIALTCGFSHQSHLNRHFKRLLGVSPKALR